jgi:hypothetical protein
MFRDHPQFRQYSSIAQIALRLPASVAAYGPTVYRRISTVHYGAVMP